MVKRIVTGLIVIVVVVGAYFGWMYIQQQKKNAELSNLQSVIISRGSLTALVGATGMVRPNQTVLLAWQTSGTVGEVQVRDGDEVQAGQVLVSLQPDSLAQNVILARSEVVNAKKALEDLLKSDVARQQASAAVVNSRKSFVEAQRLVDQFDAQNYQDKLDAAREEVANTEDDLKQAKEDFEPYQDWDAENEKRKEYEDKVDEAQNKYDEAVRVLDVLQIDQELAQINLDLAQARLADAERAFERIKDGPNPDDVSALEARLTASQATLDLARIKAPFSATVTEVDVKPGDQATPGKVVFRLDDLSRLLVDVRVSEVDINRIQLGQGVNLTFDAILGEEFHGSVTEVAKVGSIGQGVVEFIVTVELTDATEEVKPGMTAAVNIIVDQLENVLLVPNRAVRLVSGQRVVYVLTDGNMEAVKVVLGASSETDSQVVDGELRLGDVVALNPPQVFDTNGPPPFSRR